MEKLSCSIPPQFDRIIGFTIPRAGRFFICDHDEVWKVELAAPSGPEATNYAPCRFAEQNADFLGLVFDGLTANAPLTRAGDSEISWMFDPKADAVTVHCGIDGARETVEFRTFSGDWFAASLSDDGNYLVLAEPYGLAVYRLS